MSELKALWCATIIQALIDATSLKQTKTKARAHDWLTTNSDDFLEVCSYAEIQPAKLQKFYLAYEGPALTLHHLSRIKRKWEADDNSFLRDMSLD